MSVKRVSLPAALILVGLSACSGGGGGDGRHSGGSTDSATVAAMSSSLSDQDKQFITTAAQAGYDEINAGQAASGSQNPKIRAFGVEMIKEHSAMNNDLTLLATKKGITPPTDAGITNQAKGAIFNNLPGKTFDSQYVSQQLSAHQQTLTLLQQEASSGQDADLRAFARKYIPVVERHISELNSLQATMRS